MQEEELQRVALRLEADVEDLRRGLRSAQQNTNQAFNRMERDYRSFQGRFAGITKSLRGGLAGIGVGLGVGVLVSGFNEAAQAADDLRNTAVRLGATIEGVQEFRFLGEEFGIEANAADTALQRFTRRLGEAAQGTGELKGVLEQYNIAVRDSNGNTRNTEDVLYDLADAARQAESAQEQLRIATKAFDTEGAGFAGALAQGSDGLERSANRAQRLGLILRGEVVDDLADAKREIDIFEKRWDNFTTRIYGAVATAVNDSLAEINGTADDQVNVVRRRLAEQIAELEGLQKRQSVDSSGRGSLTRGRRIEELVQEIDKTKELLASLEAIEAQQAKINEQNRIDAEKKKEEERLAALAEKFAKEKGEEFDLEQKLLEVRVRHNQLEGASEAFLQRKLEMVRIQHQLEQLGLTLTEEQNANIQKSLDGLQTIQQVLDEQTAATEAAQKATEAAAEAAQRWGQTLNAALSDAIFNARSFGDILDGLIQRIGSNILFGATGTGGLLGGLTGDLGTSISGIFGFADGGIMTPRGPLPLKAYANGGIASSPQLALFGEGRTPEAFVPLPDGRSIPVKFAGGGGGGSAGPAPTVSIIQHIRFDVGLESVQAQIAQAAPLIAEQARQGTLNVLQRGA